MAHGWWGRRQEQVASPQLAGPSQRCMGVLAPTPPSAPQRQWGVGSRAGSVHPGRAPRTPHTPLVERGALGTQQALDAHQGVLQCTFRARTSRATPRGGLAGSARTTARAPPPAPLPAPARHTFRSVTPLSGPRDGPTALSRFWMPMNSTVSGVSPTISGSKNLMPCARGWGRWGGTRVLGWPALHLREERAVPVPPHTGGGRGQCGGARRVVRVEGGDALHVRQKRGGCCH